MKKTKSLFRPTNTRRASETLALWRTAAADVVVVVVAAKGFLLFLKRVRGYVSRSRRNGLLILVHDQTTMVSCLRTFRCKITRHRFDDFRQTHGDGSLFIVYIYTRPVYVIRHSSYLQYIIIQYVLHACVRDNIVVVVVVIRVPRRYLVVGKHVERKR